jgi:hypothetical protein
LNALGVDTKARLGYGEKALKADQGQRRISTADAATNARITANNDLRRGLLQLAPSILREIPTEKELAQTAKIRKETEQIGKIDPKTAAEINRIKVQTEQSRVQTRKTLAEISNLKSGGGKVPVGILTAGIAELNKNVELEKQSLLQVETVRRQRYLDMKAAEGKIDYADKKRAYDVAAGMVKEQQANLQAAQRESRRLSNEARELYGLKPIGGADGDNVSKKTDFSKMSDEELKKAFKSRL